MQDGRFPGGAVAGGNRCTQGFVVAAQSGLVGRSIDRRCVQIRHGGSERLNGRRDLARLFRGDECADQFQSEVLGNTHAGGGYAAAEEYRVDEEEKAAIAKAKAEKKEMEEKAKAQRRAARKTVKTMKKDVEEIFISKPDDLM